MPFPDLNGTQGYLEYDIDWGNLLTHEFITLLLLFSILVKKTSLI
jgi:hypothetical protein